MAAAVEDGVQARLTIERARQAHLSWSSIGAPERARKLAPIMRLIADRGEEIASRISTENGKPLAEAIGHEVSAAVRLARHHCRQAPAVLADEDITIHLQPHRRATLARRPYGVVLAIAPWNLPFIIPLSQVLPALLAGNCVVLKPSELTPQCGEEIAKLIDALDIPPNVFQLALGDGRIAAELISAHPDKVLFTGSVATGRTVMASCALFPIPVSLELGGLDAMIVRADADIEFAAAAAAWGATFNGGQACCSVERLLVHRAIFDRFTARLTDKLARIDRTRDLCPAIDERQFDTWAAHLTDARDRGLAGAANTEPLPGRRLEPTLLTGDGTTESLAWQEETFGPIVAAVPFDTDAEAIALNNATEYGLTASIFSSDTTAANQLAGQLRAGVVAINDIAATSYSCPELPWGGTGLSGFGRSHGDEGLLDSTWIQVIDRPRIRLNTKRPWWYPYNKDLEQTLLTLTHAVGGGTTGGTRWRSIAATGRSLAPLLTRNPRL